MSFNPRKNIFQSPAVQQDSKWASQWQRAGRILAVPQRGRVFVLAAWQGSPVGRDTLPAWNPWWDFPKHFSSACSAPVVNFTISSTGTGYRNTAKILPKFPSGGWKLLCFVPCPKKRMFHVPKTSISGRRSQLCHSLHDSIQGH